MSTVESVDRNDPRPRHLFSRSPRKQEVIEDAVRKELGLELLDRLWARNELSDDEAMDLAIEAQEAARRAANR